MVTFKGGLSIREHGKKVSFTDKMSTFLIYYIPIEGLLALYIYYKFLFILMLRAHLVFFFF